jgi:trans-aconitate 2-methyltransferase
MSQPWDPDRYLAYADERGRPFVDLIARIRDVEPRSVVDLGCGPGNLTQLLKRRWPSARVTGVDSSPAMIERAQQTAVDIEWELGDVHDWRGGADVVVSNATLQWVPDHLELLPRLAATAAHTFAFQVPGNFDQPSHTLRDEVSAQEPYRELTAGLARPRSRDAATYLEVLQAEGFEVDAWETTYLHVLPGEDAVFEWISGTSLLPTRAALPPELYERFAEELRTRLRAAYPARGGRVVLPFRRIFVVATRVV